MVEALRAEVATWHFPRGKRLTDFVWGGLALAIATWLVVDAGMWDQIPTFWKCLVLVMALYETYTLVNKDEEDTLSEGIWRYAPSRSMVPYMLGIMSLYLFGKPSPRDIWYLLMGHFVFQAKPPNDEELFKAAIARYGALKKVALDYGQLDAQEIDGVARELARLQSPPELTPVISIKVDDLTSEQIEKLARDLAEVTRKFGKDIAS